MVFTDEQIAKLKNKHGKVFLFTLGDKSCILKLADRNVISYATSCATIMNPGESPQFDPQKFNEAILLACWVDGDEEIKTEDKYFLGVSDLMSVVIEKIQGQVKEL
jgi:hypothetical protein